MFVIIAEISVFVTMMFNFSITFIEGRTCVVGINMQQSLFELFFSIFVINFKIFFVHGQLFCGNRFSTYGVFKIYRSSII